MSKLINLLDGDGLLEHWPSKRSVQLEALEYIANKIDKGAQFTEAEINVKLKSLHTFGDWAILRRELCETGYLKRDKNGYCYERTDK